MIKSMRIRWAGHVARIEAKKEYIEDFGKKARRNESTGKNLK
jgi:hypothetical protein